MTDLIKAFMTGELDASSFANSLKSDEGLRRGIDSLVPKDAMNNPNHPVWNRFAYSAMEKHSFSLFNLIMGMCSLDGSLGDSLNMFADIRHFYKYNNPQAYCTSYYNEIFSFSLDLVQDCFEGREVSELVESIAINLFENETEI